MADAVRAAWAEGSSAAGTAAVPAAFAREMGFAGTAEACAEHMDEMAEAGFNLFSVSVKEPDPRKRATIFRTLAG
jgi:alkanesulfonate monooxygenase SsuD/methylene tetrahydromethanopterin reductase-like flavin-dependent oxidoreductase (luciferase family)